MDNGNIEYSMYLSGSPKNLRCLKEKIKQAKIGARIHIEKAHKVVFVYAIPS